MNSNSDLPPASVPSTGPSSAQPAIEPPLSRLAVASLVCGILGFLFLPALAGLACGIVALVQISSSAGKLRGHGVALAGTIVSGVMLALVPVVAILAAMLLPALAKAKSKAQNIMGMNNVKQICLALHLRAGDEGDRLPSGTNWCDGLTQYVGGATQVFARPGVTFAQRSSSYAFNGNLAGAKITEVDPQTVLVFEAEVPGWNVAGGPELIRRPGGRGDAVVVGFVDGHVEMIGNAARLETLRWQP